MGKIHLLVANANHNFTDTELKIFRKATKQAEVFISYNFDFDYDIDLIIATPSFLIRTKPGDTTGGQTYHSRLIMLVVDNTEQAITEDHVFEVICHEMSHSLRWEKLPEYSKTMFDGMILEGLAIALEEKAMADTGRKKIENFLKEMQTTPQSEIDKMIESLKDSFYDESYDYNTIFYNGSDTLPRWAGYRLGYYFVKKYLEETGETINQATLGSYSKFTPKI